MASSPCFGQFGSAAQLIASGHWKRARTIVENRLREAPNDSLAHFYLSQIRNAFGDHSTPLALAEQAVALDAPTGKYHRQVAEVLGVMAEQSNVVRRLFLARRFRKEIDIALALDPRDVQALRDLMEFYLLAPGIAGGDPQKAGETAERIATIDPAEGFMAQARISSFEKRTADANTWLRRAAEVQPPSYRARIALAQFCLAPRHLNLRTAETAAEDAMRLEPGRVDAYAILASIYVKQDRFDELDSLLHDAAREVPDDLVPEYRAAESLAASGHEPQRAERCLRSYLAQEPEGNEPSLAEARQMLNRIAR